MWRERAGWALLLATAALLWRLAAGEAETRLSALLDGQTRLIAAQQEVIRFQHEAVDAASRAVDIAGQGRLDCAQSLEVVTQRQQWLNKGLGLSSRLPEGR